MSRIETSIAEMYNLQRIPVHYDMGDRYGNDADRDGLIEYDCSSAVSKALGISLSNNTESLKSNLPKVGYNCFYDGVDGSFDAVRGDVVIWGPRDGSSSLGAFGHVLIFVDGSNVIHCNYGSDGITVNDYNYLWQINGRPRETVFRENANAINQEPKPSGRKVYQVNAMEFVNGIWQVKCDYLCPVEFNWNDNGICVGDIDIVDKNGNLIADQECRVGSYFVFNPNKILSDNGGAYGTGGYYWRNFTFAEGGEAWLSTWDKNDLLG